jgi:hypothetical protein
MPRKKPNTKRCGKILNRTAYVYLQASNLQFAKSQGKIHGTMSAYINALICKDRGLAAPENLKGQRPLLLLKKKKAKKKRAKKPSAAAPTAPAPEVHAAETPAT